MKYWKISEYDSIVSANRYTIQRVFFLFAMVSLAINFYYGISITQIGANPLLKQDADPTYILFMLLKIPQMISGTLAPWFDALLVISCVACFAWPGKQMFPLTFFLLHFIYFIVYNMMSGHHYISIGLLVMSFPFIFKRSSRFTSVFTLCRFILCFMMFSAACWKIARGNLFHIDQANMLLISTHIDELSGARQNIGTFLIQWLLQHKIVSYIIWCLLIVVEGIFVLGFISFRWDKLLLVCYLLFFIGGWLLFNIYNYDNLLFLLTLVPVLNLISRQKKPFAMPILNNSEASIRQILKKDQG